jgi:hypothetical protein
MLALPSDLDESGVGVLNFSSTADEFILKQSRLVTKSAKANPQAVASFFCAIPKNLVM